jgi:3',5'-cyclic AMP phosphodiesterase CpdA
MRTLAHLSDIHFGSVDREILEPLIETVNRLKPDVVAVSGDLTQRARRRQFEDARAFLDRLPKPQIVVPGNHDIPLDNVFTRFLQPLAKYRRYVSEDLQPFYADEEILVLGVNTARSLTVKGGRVNKRQISWLREKLCAPSGANVVKIIVTHHPFDLPENHDERELVGRANLAMPVLAECGADLFLAGHLHVAHAGRTAERYKIQGHSAIIVQAGTAASTRGRGEANSFNFIGIAHPNIKIERFVWQPVKRVFVNSSIERFRKESEGWVYSPLG